MEDSMDIDIDLGDDLDYGHAAGHTIPIDAVAGAPEQSLSATPAALDQEKDIPEAYKEDFDSSFPAKEKIHIRGLDGVAQPLILEFIASHHPDLKHRRLEWIDDTSANIIYHSAQDASDALRLLSVEADTLPGPLELRPAKTFAQRPDLQFTIRQALVGDRKVAGAKDRSAFYLFNPEWDPENRKGDARRDRRGGGRSRGSYGARDGRRGNDDGRRRRREPEKVTFTEDFYDDPPAGLGDEAGEMLRRMSTTSLSSGSMDHARPKRKYEDADLFEGKRAVGRLDNRSRSPLRDGDGRYGFGGEDDETQPRRKTARSAVRRDRTPLGRGGARNAGKELFGPPPTQANAAPQTTPVGKGNQGVELFPSGSHSAKRSRELFPHHTARSNHRRNDALDKEDTVEIFAQQSRSLADRISGLPATNGSPQRGGGDVGGSGAGILGSGGGAASNGFSIRGAGDANSGFSIRGVASREIGAKVKELFPDKMGASNKGKELFPGAAPRGGARRRAEDMMS